MSSLAGIKVLDLSRLLPGPYCSMILADHGADVIAIEDKRFQADDLFFGDLYRNKRHMSLNLKSEQGRQIFFQLAEEADVVLEGFRPGVVERLGVGYEQLCKHNPRIIYCSISGYGQHGSESQKPGHDVNYLSKAGVLAQIGEDGGPPIIPSVQIADIAGGGMNAVIGILLALHERNTSGMGQFIDISMTDGVLGLLTLPYVLQKKTGTPQNRSSSMLSHGYACYNTYETADGRYLAIGAVENRFWTALCSLLGVEEYSALQYDESKTSEIIQHLRRIFKQHPINHWEKILSGADVCYSKIQEVEEVLIDPVFIERQMVVELDTQSGKEKAFGIPVKLSRSPGSIRTVPQSFGEATAEVLTELGYTQDTIRSLFEENVV